MPLFARHLRSSGEDGQALIEYALILAFVALAIFAVLAALGGAVAGVIAQATAVL